MGTLPIILSLLLWSVASAQDMDSKQSEYSNMWIAEIHGGEEVAQRVARDLGYTYSGKVSTAIRKREEVITSFEY